MKSAIQTILTVLTALALAACACVGCPEDSVDGPALAFQAHPTGAERGAYASLLDVITAVAGPEDPAVRALDSAFGADAVSIGRFAHAPGEERMFGYVLMKDGRIALDDRYARAVPADSAFLANPRSWMFAPVLYAAGYRLAHGGSWVESMNAAAAFAPRLAERLRAGALDTFLPSGADRSRAEEALGAWMEVR